MCRTCKIWFQTDLGSENSASSVPREARVEQVNFYFDILHLYNIVIPSLRSVLNICKPEEGWYGRPKYYYKKQYTLLNQPCSSLWTSRSWLFIWKLSADQLIVLLDRDSVNVHPNTRHSSHYKSENRPYRWVLKFFLTVYLRAHAYFHRPEYWMSAICISKLWNTAFCPRSVW